jgi:hypothetical protein
LSEEILISIVSVFSLAIFILNNMFVVVIYCVQLFLEVFFPKSFSSFLFLSFANYFSLFPESV